MTVHPLRPVTHLRLGRLLPYQLANRPQAHPSAVAKRPPFSFPTYAVLASISRGYSSPKGRFPRVTHPCATVLILADFLVRLACVRHAASVHSEPGSNSPYRNFKNPSKVQVILFVYLTKLVRVYISKIFFKLTTSFFAP